MNSEEMLVTMTRRQLKRLVYDAVLLALQANEKQEVAKESKLEFLTVREAAKFLDLSVPTIYSKVHHRKLPYVKRGKRLYFSKQKLERYLETGQVQDFDGSDCLNKNIKPISRIIKENQKVSRR
jgi:excisionase family DNA binding protein